MIKMAFFHEQSASSELYLSIKDFDMLINKI